ncbi:hypothetical protein B0T13DRAFT_444418 [Neurospora crassa]|nr:hypothetical protein B0T13DRAFT_444418 [Neurospora crassa]
MWGAAGERGKGAVEVGMMTVAMGAHHARYLRASMAAGRNQSSVLSGSGELFGWYSNLRNPNPDLHNARSVLLLLPSVPCPGGSASVGYDSKPLDPRKKEAAVPERPKGGPGVHSVCRCWSLCVWQCRADDGMLRAGGTWVTLCSRIFNGEQDPALFLQLGRQGEGRNTLIFAPGTGLIIVPRWSWISIGPSLGLKNLETVWSEIKVVLDEMQKTAMGDAMISTNAKKVEELGILGTDRVALGGYQGTGPPELCDEHIGIPIRHQVGPLARLGDA